MDLHDVHPELKAGLIQPLPTTAEPGHTVVQIGSGYGVATVRAARAVAQTGHVYSFDAVDEWLQQARETVALNDVSDRVTFGHAVVARAETAWGATLGPKGLSVSDLPKGDCFVLDCEGSEVFIFQEMLTTDWRPDRIVVESHTFAGADPNLLKADLEQHGYVVVSESVVPRARHDRQDDRTVHAVRSES